MDADPLTLRDAFLGDRRFEVPVYQRPYVWTKEDQWEPLWNDVEATAQRLAEARQLGPHQSLAKSAAEKLAPPHFLGAVVIEQSQVVTGDVDTRLIVDGQQRLTTLQLLIRGVLDALENVNASKKARSTLRKAIENDADVVAPEKLAKLQPRKADVQDYTEAMASEVPDIEHSSFASARDFFRECAAGFIQDESVPVDPYDPIEPPEVDRAELLVATLMDRIKLVVIDLEEEDDAQVIFEALNARNTPLSATDLVKNLLFLRAQKERDDSDVLYESRWKRFDEDSDWWLERTGAGHAQRARQDWLLGDWMTAQLARPVNVGRLYAEFRRWLEQSGSAAIDALQTLNRYADAYEALNGRNEEATEIEREVFAMIDEFGITATTPLLLLLYVQPESRITVADRERAFQAIASFLLRRMVTKAQTRAYGQAFADVLKRVRAAEESGENLADTVIHALRSAPHGYVWPSDDEIESSFVHSRFYGPGGINQRRIRFILGAVELQLQSEATKSEPITISVDGLQVEHIIPRTWRTTWPVGKGKGMAATLAEQERDAQVDRIGNLTLATGSLNASLSNNPWESKRKELRKHSKLHLNAELLEKDAWDEAAIEDRGRWLASRVAEIWPGAHSEVWDASTTD
ncbi:MAG: DUF262 domain-containing protein [Thermoleophilaceae bacterium]|nr:DUF262 domain-containing protein [Thermoleophilaceae bacterium]